MDIYSFFYKIGFITYVLMNFKFKENQNIQYQNKYGCR